jgi:hypothetical protein
MVLSSCMVARGCVMEMRMGAAILSGELTERHGHVHRPIRDAQLEGFADALATRIGSFGPQAIPDAKSLVDRASSPPDAEVQVRRNTSITCVRRPGTAGQVGAPIELRPGNPETSRSISTSTRQSMRNREHGKADVSLRGAEV